MATASDLPEYGYRTSYQMAQKLVTYLDDPEVIRRAIKLEFDHAPDERTIRELRSHHLRAAKPEPRKVFSRHEGYYPENVEEIAAERNRRFLKALRNAHPERFPIADLVNGRWDDEIERARG